MCSRYSYMLKAYKHQVKHKNTLQCNVFLLKKQWYVETNKKNKQSTAWTTEVHYVQCFLGGGGGGIHVSNGRKPCWSKQAGGGGTGNKEDEVIGKSANNCSCHGNWHGEGEGGRTGQANEEALVEYCAESAYEDCVIARIRSDDVGQINQGAINLQHCLALPD